MNAQLLELEEQVHKQSQNNSTPSKKNSSSKTSGSKKREEGSVSSSSSTSTGKDLEIISSTSTSLNDSNSSLTFTSSTVQQLFLSLHQEIKNWKLLTICRLIQSFKLRPLPIPKHQEYLFSRNDDLKGDKGIEEKKEYDVIKSLNTMISRHEVHKLKRLIP